MSTSDKQVNIAEMSDDEILELDIDAVDGLDPETDDEDPGEPNETSGQVDDEENDDSEDGSEDTDPDDTDDDDPDESDADDDDTEAGNQNQASGDTDVGSGEQSDKDNDTPAKVNYKSEYKSLLSPFKAAGREIKVNNINDARRLMQMGVDYSRKMEAMKPHQRILKTLERNELLDIDKINFLIDLDKHNPEAIQKFLKDSDIDPMDLDYEDDTTYKPTDHSVGDQEMALDDVLDEIRGTESFSRTVNEITDKWDTASREVLMKEPNLIAIINDHVGSGIYDQVISAVEQERVFGRLKGMSDLEAYKAVGDAIAEKGGFTNQPESRTSAKAGANQNLGQDSKNIRNRKRAAGPAKGTVNKGAKSKIDLSTLSDADIEKLDPATL